MKLDALVLDFDGTLTDLDEESKRFVAGFKADVDEIGEVHGEAFEELWSLALMCVRETPERYTFRKDGYLVVPPPQDPYHLVRSAAAVVFDMQRIFIDERERQDILDGLFFQNYDSLRVQFKDDAAWFLDEVVSRFPVYIISNSSTRSVTQRLRLLDLSCLEYVSIIGSAKKDLIDTAWTDVPETTRPDGSGRKVHLRRRHYHEALEIVRSDVGMSVDVNYCDMAVIGDIFEFDLALPMHLGMHTCLAIREGTQLSEISAVRSYDRGACAKSLQEALDWLDG